MSEVIDKPPRPKAPGSYRGVVLIIRLRLIFLGFVCGLLFWVALTDGPAQSRVRAAILRGAGLGAAAGTDEDIGYVFGTMLIPILLVIAEWVLLRRRKLLPFRVVAGIDLFALLGNQSAGFILPLMLIVFSCLPSFREYCDATANEQTPSIWNPPG